MLLAMALGLRPAHCVAAAAYKQADLIAVLQSDSPPSEKAITCKRLAIYGDGKAVPALAPLLADIQLASWARIALEAIPDPAADAALREAAGKLKGRLLIGTINSIGVRRDEKAIPVLAGKLADADADVASAAAVALGHIGSDAAVKPLPPLLTKAPAKVRPAVAEGCILAAEKRLSEKNFSEALVLYNAVRSAKVSKQKSLEAIRGAILAMQSEGIPLLAEQLKSKDKDIFSIGLRTAREIPGPATAKALLAELKQSDPQRQAKLLLALAERGDPEALPVAIQMAEEGEQKARLMAVNILRKLGNPAAAGTLMKLMTKDDAELALAAKRVLMRLPGKEIDSAIAVMLKDQKPEARSQAINMIMQRKTAGMVPTLIKVAQTDSEQVRVAAIKALGKLCGVDQLQALLGLLAKGKSADDIQAAERAVTSVCMRSAKIATGNVVILKAMYGDLPKGKKADVTRKVLKMVGDGKLEIEASNNNFGDPAPSTFKSLQIDYKVAGRVDSKTAKEGETITIAARAVDPACTEAVLAALPGAPLEPKKALLRILRAFGGQSALKAIRIASTDANSEIRESALRALFEWPSADALPDLAKLARNAPSETFKILALRGYIRLIQEQDAPVGKKVTALKDASSLAKRTEEKKILLAALGTVPAVEALTLVMPHLENPALKEEAAAAVVGIAEKIRAPRPPAVTEALGAAAKATRNQQTAKRAKALLK
jgi:HEAT repeat protein